MSGLYEGIKIKTAILLTATFCIAILSFTGCTDTNGTLTDESAGAGVGMLLVKSSGDTVTLGTDAASAPLSSRPSMRAAFTYGYSLLKHEVTRGEYSDLTGGSVADSVRNYPQTEVTYYDAVLFANLRSKSEGLDTVYTYASLTRDADGSCTSLGGLVTRLGRDGYRLPTEAEWTYAASLGWDPSGKAWTADNSGYALHAACSAGTDAAGFCDLAGNALEWTDDWLGSFRDTTVTDFAGAPDGGSVGERVVKGGSYRNAAANTRLYLRGDVYTVTGATKSAYVGFRLARGVVGNPSWLSSAGATTSRISVTAGVSSLRSLLGTYRAKLAFRDDATGNIAYVDFSSGVPSAREIADTVDAYHPDISPDGKRVAFCTRPEGISGTSAVYVRNLDSAGTGLVRLEVASAAIPRWRVSGTDTSIVYVTDAGDDSDLPVWERRSTWEVPFSGGKFGTPSKLLDGAFNAGLSADGSLAVTGSKLLRASVGGRDTVWYGGEQACNASLSRDSLKRTLFLDFGGDKGRAYAGSDYAAHGMLLVADSLGRLTGAVPSPAGETFDHTEWVLGAGGFAVASLADAEGAHTELALVKLADSSVTSLAEGDELWHPCLWVGAGAASGTDTTGASFVLDPDSAGAYLTSGGTWTAEMMRVKMELFWKMKDTVNFAFVGSSHVEDGLNPTLLTSGTALNMGHPANDMDASIYIAENYFMNHAPELKAVVISLDFGLWQNTTSASDLLFKTYPGYIYDANHDFWIDSLPSNFIPALEQSYPASVAAQNAYAPYYGFINNANGTWSPTLVESDSLWATKDYAAVAWNLNRLRLFIEAAQTKKVAVVGIIFPQSPDYRNTGSFGRYGPQRSVALRLIDTLQRYQSQYSNFHLMDENRMGDHDYTDEMAINCDHLSGTGAAQLTARLDSVLKTLK